MLIAAPLVHEWRDSGLTFFSVVHYLDAILTDMTSSMLRQEHASGASPEGNKCLEYDLEKNRYVLFRKAFLYFCDSRIIPTAR